MAGATFTIDVRGGGDVQRVLEGIAGAVYRTNQGLEGSYRRTARAQENEAKRGARGSVDAAKGAHAQKVKLLTDYQRAERLATSIALQEAQRRGWGEAQTAVRRRGILRTLVQAHRDAEAQMTRASEDGARRRGRASERAGRGPGGGGGGQLLGSARAAVTGMHGEIQDARRRRAGAARTLGLAVYSAGGDRGEAAERMGALTAFAERHGLDSSELADAAKRSQDEFSTLAGADPTARRGRFDTFLQTALLARNTGNDVGEFTRLQGLFAQQRVDPDTQRRLLLFATGAAQQGAVETGDVTRSAMPAILRRIAQAQQGLAANATPAQRNQALQGAFVQSFAELQIARGAGIAPGRAGAVMAELGTALGGTVVQDRLRNNILQSRDLTRAQRTEYETTLFEDDPNRRGHRRLRQNFRDPLTFMQRVAEMSGDNAQLFGNLFAGGGHGNAQGLQRNWRNMLGSFMNADTEGTPGYERVRRLMNVGRTSLTEADVTRGEGIFSNDQLSQLTRAQEGHDSALTDNTSAINNLSNRVADWLQRNPMGGALAQVGGTALGGLLGGGGGGAGGGLLGGAGRLLGVGGGVAGAAIAGTALAAFGLYSMNEDVNARTGTTLGQRAGASLSGMFGGAGERQLGDQVEARREAMRQQGNAEWNNRNWQGAGGQGRLQQIFGGAPTMRIDPASLAQLAEAMRANPPRVDPHDASFLGAQNASGANPPPPEHRR